MLEQARAEFEAERRPGRRGAHARGARIRRVETVGTTMRSLAYSPRAPRGGRGPLTTRSGSAWPSSRWACVYLAPRGSTRSHRASFEHALEVGHRAENARGVIHAVQRPRRIALGAWRIHRRALAGTRGPARGRGDRLPACRGSSDRQRGRDLPAARASSSRRWRSRALQPRCRLRGRRIVSA